jgi:hypothetical protein
MTIVDYLIASLPANTTRFSCDRCLPSIPPGYAGYGVLWISAVRNGVETWSVQVGLPPE